MGISGVVGSVQNRFVSAVYWVKQHQFKTAAIAIFAGGGAAAAHRQLSDPVRIIKAEGNNITIAKLHALAVGSKGRLGQQNGEAVKRLWSQLDKTKEQQKHDELAKKAFEQGLALKKLFIERGNGISKMSAMRQIHANLSLKFSQEEIEAYPESVQKALRAFMRTQDYQRQYAETKGNKDYLSRVDEKEQLVTTIIGEK